MNKDSSASVNATDLNEIAGMMQSNPGGAEEKLRSLLASSPDDPNAKHLLAISLRLQGKFGEALKGFQDLITSSPANPFLHQDLGLTLLSSGNLMGARDALRQAVGLKPDLALSWQVLTDIYGRLGDTIGAQEARLKYQAAMGSTGGTQNITMHLQQVERLLSAGQLAQAEGLCRQCHQMDPGNPDVYYLLGRIAFEMNAFADAARMFDQCLGLSPNHLRAHLGLAWTHYQTGHSADALSQLDLIDAVKENNPNALLLRAKIDFDNGRYDAALSNFETLIAEHGKVAPTMLEYGHALRAAGRKDEAVQAYRDSEALNPGYGHAWFALANMKSDVFNDDDIETMRALLAKDDLRRDDRQQILFALGEALESTGDWDGSFAAYKEGNDLQRQAVRYDRAGVHGFIEDTMTSYGKDLIDALGGKGLADADPIFIVGMPRSGTTLIEQILSSHSLVDGTFELPHIQQIANDLSGDPKLGTTLYPKGLGDLDSAVFETLGRSYLDNTRHLRSGNPHFVDKMPGNFLHIGLIKLMLPNARIINVQRDPMANCFSIWKQNFANAAGFSYGFEELGEHYRDYIQLMDYWNSLFPGEIYTVVYEDLVADREGQTRGLLEACNLPFEEACLEPHKTARVIRSFSSEQVRQPIYDSALNHWRHYEQHLGPLKEALAPLSGRFDLT